MFTPLQKKLINQIIEFIKQDDVVKFIQWNYDKIGESGGGNIEGWLERELDFYLSTLGWNVIPKKINQADLIIKTPGTPISRELWIEIRTGSKPSRYWFTKKIIDNEKNKISVGMYMYLYRFSKRTLLDIKSWLKNRKYYHETIMINEKLCLIFARARRIDSETFKNW